MSKRISILTAGYILAQVGSLYGQTPLVDWSHTWNFMHPTTGNLPAGSGATEPNSGATKWYAAEANFAATYTGPSFTTSGAGYEAGTGSGPIGYGAMDYVGNPQPAPGQFAGLSTTLTTPASGSRYTGYFRTTFEVPSDGNFYVSPKLRYLLDDGGFVYLDGVPVLRVNMASTAADDYKALAPNTTNTESHVREADLSLAVGSTTGGSTGIGGNAVVLKRIVNLAPGTHTLAISVHNQAAGSSDLDLAAQLVATPSDCSITATASNVTRSTNGTPSDPSDDTISFKVSVAPTGNVSSTWEVFLPGDSAAAGTTGAYNTEVAITGIPIFEFASGSLTLTIGDSGNPACTTTFSVVPHRIIATNDMVEPGSPVFTSGTLPSSGWVFDDTLRSVVMNNGGGGSRKVFASEVIDLSALPAVQFSGALEINDTSTGNEAGDSFVAYLIINGDTANPINLITPYDTQVVDGVLSDDELAPGSGDFVKDLRYIIPASANSVQIIVEGINDSNSEKFTVRDFNLGAAPPTIQALAGAAVFNNHGTADPSDDTFSAPVTIDGINLSPSTGWTSDSTPASGLYAAPQPVTFGPFPAASSPRQIIFADALNPAVASSVILTAPAPALTAAAATNVVRHENGPGLADDTVTFDVALAGTNGGPGWQTPTPGISPVSGSFGTVSFTVAAPLPASPFTVLIEDASYPAASQTISVALPGRYTVGQRDFGSGPVDVISDIASVPAPEWANDPAARTLTMSTSPAAEKQVITETINLTAVGEVQFTAQLNMADTSAGSNFEITDKFKAELIYTVGGLPVTINLVDPYDIGDGAASTTGTTGGLNGPKDGYLNGYSGAAGTDLETAVVYATGLEDYDAHVSRDEFNRNLEPGVNHMTSVFELSATIPANADSVKLVVTGVGIGGTETAVLSSVVFTAAAGPADTDGDGMDDVWELANGLNPADAGDKFKDLDSDGLDNYSEFLAGTAANDPKSNFLITATVPGAGPDEYNITFSSVAGRKYQFEESADLGSWGAVPGVITATGASTTVPVNAAGLGLRHFLRIKVVP